MKKLTEYLMMHGILKNADAERMATEILAQREVQLKSALEEVETLKSWGKLQQEERDAAVREANRRDQKWMDGINEIVGRKLDYGDPCSRDNAASALGKWADELKGRESGPCHECRTPAMPMISVTGPHFPRGTGKIRHFCSCHCFWKWIQRVESARDEAGRGDRVYSWD